MQICSWEDILKGKTQEKPYTFIFLEQAQVKIRFILFVKRGIGAKEGCDSLFYYIQKVT